MIQVYREASTKPPVRVPFFPTMSPSIVTQVSPVSPPTRVAVASVLHTSTLANTCAKTWESRVYNSTQVDVFSGRFRIPTPQNLALESVRPSLHCGAHQHPGKHLQEDVFSVFLFLSLSSKVLSLEESIILCCIPAPWCTPAQGCYLGSHSLPVPQNLSVEESGLPNVVVHTSKSANINPCR